MEQFVGFGKANLLASFALFDDDPGRINTLEAGFRQVTPEILRKTAQDYLRSTNRTIEFIKPAAKAAGSN
jgi:predicted Zn-dependent peptidase